MQPPLLKAFPALQFGLVFLLSHLWIKGKVVTFWYCLAHHISLLLPDLVFIIAFIAMNFFDFLP